MIQTKTIRVITVDDHEILRGGIKFSLLAFDDIDLVGEAHGGEDAVRLCEHEQPDVVLMDLMMPGMDGVATTEAIKKQFPQIQVLILTSFHEHAQVQQALQAGAIGYLLKGVSIDALAEAIRAAHAGRSTLGPEATEALIAQVTQPFQLGKDLTEREREALALMIKGLNNGQIAERLTISRNTVRHHVRNILAKLEAANRTEAVSVAVQLGLGP